MGGIMVGFAIGHEYARRSVSQIYAEQALIEAQESRDIYQEKLKALKEEQKPKEEPKLQRELNPSSVSHVSPDNVNYSKFAKAKADEEKRQEELKQPGKDLPEADDSEIYEDYEDDYEDEIDLGQYHPDNIDATNKNEDFETPEPFRISTEQFMSEFSLNEQISLEYYPSDKLVVDQSMVPVPNHEQFVGNFTEVFDRNEQGDTDVIFIRNNAMRADIEFIVNEGITYAEAQVKWKEGLAAARKRRKEKEERHGRGI